MMAGKSRYHINGVNHLITRIANELRRESGGSRIVTSRLRIRVAEEFRARPDLINIDRQATDACKRWERINNKLIAAKLEQGELFVPGLYVAVGKGERAQTTTMDPMVDIPAWIETLEEALRKHTDSFKRIEAHARRVLADAKDNPDLRTWLELEMRVRGYKPKPNDDQPFTSEENGDDTEEENDGT